MDREQVIMLASEVHRVPVESGCTDSSQVIAEELAESERTAQEVLALPTFPGMTEQQQHVVASTARLLDTLSPLQVTLQ